MNEQSNKEIIINAFNTVASGYDNPALHFFPKSAEHLASYLELKGDEHVLDVATGTGSAAFALAKHLPHGRVTGIDFSKGMLEQAIRKRDEMDISNTDFVEMDMQALKYPGDYFDAAVCSFGIFFVEDMLGQLGQISDKVRYGGRVVITSFQKNTFSPLADMFLDCIGRYGVESPTDIWKSVGTLKECTALFRSAGLEDIQSSQKDLGYYLRDASEWWDIIWNAGFRRLVDQLSPPNVKRFKSEHLDEVEKLSSDQGIKLEVIVLYTLGVKTGSAGGNNRPQTQ